MALSQETKQQIFTDYQIHPTDTGSSEVQIALLSAQINRLSEHLKTNDKDYASERGLKLMLGRRKRLLQYLQKESLERYQTLITRLGIRG